MAEWTRVAGVTDCPPGTVASVEVGGEKVALVNVDGDYYALRDRCTHQDYPLSDGDLQGEKLECIYHGAAFDVCSGRALQLPAIRPVKTYEVDVREDGVYILRG